jgi:hypothetical protein
MWRWARNDAQEPYKGVDVRHSMASALEEIVHEHEHAEHEHAEHDKEGGR